MTPSINTDKFAGKVVISEAITPASYHFLSSFLSEKCGPLSAVLACYYMYLISWFFVNMMVDQIKSEQYDQIKLECAAKVKKKPSKSRSH